MSSAQEEVVPFLEKLRCLVDIRGGMYRALQTHHHFLSELFMDRDGFLQYGGKSTV